MTNVLLIHYEVHIPAAQSLKDKRSVIKSLTHRLRTTYNVSVAEVDYQDKWQRATLAVSAVSAQRDHLEELSRRLVTEIESRLDLVITGIDEEWL
ncbi:DUF503 domain-containing protein [bacterium]|nr:DUF503 domain-containing protein [bacterium]